MAKNNDYRKVFRIDRFARNFYCQHARLNQLRSDKKQAKKAVRILNKKITRNVNKTDQKVEE